MRRKKKEQLLSLMQEYGEAHTELERLYQKGDLEACCELLTTCQETAVAIGEQIEEEEGSGTQTVHRIEEYCEDLYESHHAVAVQDLGRVLHSFSKLRTQWKEVEKTFQEEIQVILEIVFLPYKASMWDSMESIYLAAKADPSCHAVVLPIPYYDRNYAHELTTKHNETNLFPPDLSCKSCEEYHLQDVQPDIIYIHNPFDGGNAVTSIDPRFYSNALKKNCSKLVYVPYYVSAGGIHSFQLNFFAYPFVDYVVAQSYNLLPYFSSLIKREQFIVTGSPKFDQMLAVCNTPAKMPQAWMERASDKKLFFYNTSIEEAILYKEGFLKKLAYVFFQFKDREDFCLIWRPHPLLEATFSSMLPELGRKYLAIQERFIQDGYGIYDDTESPEQAMALADAYLGGWTSALATMFGITGKPLFLLDQNVHCLPEQGDYLGTLFGGRVDELDGNYMVTEGSQLFGRGEDGIFRFCCRLSEDSGKAYGRVFEEEDRLYIAPLHSFQILVKEGEGECRSIPLKPCEVTLAPFADSIRVGDFLFLIPQTYPFLVRMDFRTEELHYVEVSEPFFDVDEEGNPNTRGYCLFRNFLFFSSVNDSKILAVDVKSLEKQTVLPGEDLRAGGYTLLTTDLRKETVWMLSADDMSVCRWNPENGDDRCFDCSQEEIGLFDCGFEVLGKIRPFSSMVDTKKGLLLAPASGDRFFLLSADDEKFHVWTPPFTMSLKPGSDYASCPFLGILFRQKEAFGAEKRDAGSIRYFSMPDRKLYEIAEDLDSYTEIPLRFSLKELKEHCYGFARRNPWQRYGCYEDYFHTLPAFLSDRLPGNPHCKEEQIRDYSEIIENTDGTCGKKTHEEVKRRLFED